MDLEKKIEIALEGMGINLYDISTTKEDDKNIFRVYITKKDGVSIEDCANATKLINPILDLDSPFNSEYNLEVSSPGIERKLKKLQHYKHSIGENVKIKLNSLQIIKGKLLDTKDEVIIVEDLSGEIFNISYDDILSGSTYFDF